jgi:16S rRNA (cytosine1402-N4)-methyltransferase
LKYHKPVLLQEALHYLEVKPFGKYIDATLGGGGHSQAIIHLGGDVLGLDQDLEAINACPDLDRLTKVHTNFTHLKEEAVAHQFSPVDGVLFDFGVSSHQLDTAVRGFSFQKDGPLDMRMGQTAISAADLINQLPLPQLTNLFHDLGEIPSSRSLAEKIIANRPFETTSQLATTTGVWSRQAFQAIRIAVNDELGAIRQALPQALEILSSKGVIVAIAFHSLEDRIVKQQFIEWARKGVGEILTEKPITASTEEVEENSRAKSAKLRAFKKL